MFYLEKGSLAIIIRHMTLLNILCLRVVCTARSRKETELNYTIQPFSREFFDAISAND
jgi:hypothetical protein